MSVNDRDTRVEVLTQFIEGATMGADGLNHLRVTHMPTGLSAEARFPSQYHCVRDAKAQIEQRMAELQRLDLSDPRRALEELATVPSLRERAEAALRLLDEADRDSDGMDPGPCHVCGGVGKLIRIDSTRVDCPECSGIPYRSPDDQWHDAIDDARDEARRLLAEVLL